MSKVLLNWIADPVVKMDLGRSVLSEIQQTSDLNVDIGFDYKSAAV